MYVLNWAEQQCIATCQYSHIDIQSCWLVNRASRSNLSRVSVLNCKSRIIISRFCFHFSDTVSKVHSFSATESFCVLWDDINPTYPIFYKI